MNVQTWREERSGPYQTPQVLIITVTNKGLKGTKSFNEVLELLDITISIVTKSFKEVHIANIDIITEKDTPREKHEAQKNKIYSFFVVVVVVRKFRMKNSKIGFLCAKKP